MFTQMKKCTNTKCI